MIEKKDKDKDKDKGKGKDKDLKTWLSHFTHFQLVQHMRNYYKLCK